VRDPRDDARASREQYSPYLRGGRVRRSDSGRGSASQEEQKAARRRTHQLDVLATFLAAAFAIMVVARCGEAA